MVIFLLAPLKVARHKPQLRIILNYTNYPTIPILTSHKISFLRRERISKNVFYEVVLGDEICVTGKAKLVLALFDTA
jgi:hypothetical protein